MATASADLYLIGIAQPIVPWADRTGTVLRPIEAKIVALLLSVRATSWPVTIDHADLPGNYGDLVPADKRIGTVVEAWYDTELGLMALVKIFGDRPEVRAALFVLSIPLGADSNPRRPPLYAILRRTVPSTASHSTRTMKSWSRPVLTLATCRRSASPTWASRRTPRGPAFTIICRSSGRMGAGCAAIASPLFRR